MSFGTITSEERMQISQSVFHICFLLASLGGILNILNSAAGGEKSRVLSHFVAEPVCAHKQSQNIFFYYFFFF